MRARSATVSNLGFGFAKDVVQENGQEVAPNPRPDLGVRSCHGGSGVVATETPAVWSGGARRPGAKCHPSKTSHWAPQGVSLGKSAAGAGCQTPRRRSRAAAEELPAVGAVVPRCPGAERRRAKPSVGFRNRGGLGKSAGSSSEPAAGAGGQKPLRRSGPAPMRLRLSWPGGREFRARSATLPEHWVGVWQGVVQANRQVVARSRGSEAAPEVGGRGR